MQKTPGWGSPRAFRAHRPELWVSPLRPETMVTAVLSFRLPETVKLLS
jgi:hypothetical protein